MSEEIFDRETKIIVGDLEVSDLRVVFRVAKDSAQDPNSASIAIYNLSATNRARIGEYNAKMGSNRIIPVRIEAGYKSLGGASLIFEGELGETASIRQGATWITTIGAGDGETSMRVARIKKKFPRGTQPVDIVRALLESAGLGEGNLSTVASLLRSNGTASFTLAGPVAYHLENWTKPFGVTWSIQNGIPTFGELNLPSKGRVVELTPETGLIGSPVIEANDGVSCVARILPDLDINNVFKLSSDSVSGNFKIDHCEFSGDTRGAEYAVRIMGSRY